MPVFPMQIPQSEPHGDGGGATLLVPQERVSHPDIGMFGAADLENLRSEMVTMMNALEERLRREFSHSAKQEPRAPESKEEQEQRDVIGEGADDAEEVEDCDPREYELQESVWDAVLVMRLGKAGKQSLADNSFLLIVLLLNVAVQIIFCAIVRMYMLESPMDGPKLRSLAMWRMIVGHKSDYYDPMTDTSLVTRVCAEAPIGIMGAAQQAWYRDLQHYNVGQGSIMDMIVSPPALCVIALVFWLLMMIRDALNTFDFMRAVLSTPKAPVSEVEEDGSLATISWSRLIFLFSIMIIPKFGIAASIGWLGIRWLVITHDPGDLILNAVALEAVINSDELLYSLVPHRHRIILRKINSIPIPRGARLPLRLRTRFPVRPFLICFFVLGTIVCVVPTMLSTEVGNATEAARLICGNDTEFVYAVDKATGVVSIADTSLWDDVDVDGTFQGHVFRSVLQKTGLSYEETLSVVSVEVQGIIFNPTTSNKLNEMETQNKDEAADEYKCEHAFSQLDGLPSNRSMQEGLHELTGRDWCENLTLGTDDCLQPAVRTICPVACGCEEPYEGLFDKTGCPRDCDRLSDARFIASMSFRRGLASEISVYNCGDEIYYYEAFPRYFDRLQEFLVEDGKLVLDASSGIEVLTPAWPFHRTLAVLSWFGFYYDPTFNFTLGALAAQSYKHFGDLTPLGAEQDEDRLPCKFIEFVFFIFHFDACHADTAYPDKNLGAIRQMCPKTCGYCDEPEEGGGVLKPYAGRHIDNILEFASEVGIPAFAPSSPDNEDDQWARCKFYEQNYWWYDEHMKPMCEAIVDLLRVR